MRLHQFWTYRRRIRYGQGRKAMARYRSKRRIR